MLNFNKLKNIIIIVPHRLGDTLFCTQALRFLKESNSRLNIDVFAPTKLAAEILANNSYINKIYLEPINKKYDLLIDISGAEATAKYHKYFVAETVIYKDDMNPRLHSAERLLQFFAQIFNIKIDQFARHYDAYPQQSNRDNIAKVLPKQKKQFLLGFHMGCFGLSKNRSRLWGRFKHDRAWPVKKFIKLARKLQQHNSNINVVLTGTKAEAKLAQYFCRKVANTINLVNKTSVLDLAALMSKLQLLVTNDTGVMHLACAKELPLVVLYGDNNKIINYPYPAASYRVILHKPKITRITVAAVLQIILELKC